VPSGEANVVQVVEPEAELRADERIGRGVHLAGHAVGLEAENTSCHIIHIISPASNDRVSVNFFARYSSRGEGAFEGVPSFFIGDFLFEADTASGSDEGVLSAAAEWYVGYLESPQVVTSSDLRQKKCPHLHCALEKPSFRKVSVG